MLQNRSSLKNYIFTLFRENNMNFVYFNFFYQKKINFLDKNLKVYYLNFLDNLVYLKNSYFIFFNNSEFYKLLLYFYFNNNFFENLKFFGIVKNNYFLNCYNKIELEKYLLLIFNKYLNFYFFIFEVYYYIIFFLKKNLYKLIYILKKRC